MNDISWDCMCKNNDPGCARCWDEVEPATLSQFDRDLRYRFDECLELLTRKTQGLWTCEHC